MGFGNSLRSVAARLGPGIGLRWPLQPWQSVIALALLAGAALVGFSAHQMQRQHARELTATGTRTQNITRVLEGHTQEVLHRLDLLMAHAARQIADTALPLSADTPALRQQLRALVPVDGLIRSYWVIGLDGALVASSARDQASDPPGWGGRDHVAVHRARADRGVYLGATVADGLKGLPIIPVSLRLEGPGGQFAGVLVAWVDPGYFQRFYDSINKGSDGFVTLFGRDGSILARSPFNAGVMLRNWRDSPLFKQHLPDASEKTVRQVVVADGVDRVYSYRALPLYPVIVSVGLSVDEVLVPWHAAVWRDVALTGLSLVVLAAVAGLLARQLRTGQQMARQLADSEARWKFAIEAPGDAVLDWDVPTGAVYFNSRWKSMLGYADDELGQHIDDWVGRIHPEDRDRVWAAVQDHHEGRSASYACELRVACKDGSWKWILDRGVVIKRDAHGRPLRMIGTQSDISARKHTEESLEHSRERVRALSDVTFEAVFISVKGICREQNRQAQQMFGYSDDEAVGQPGIRWIAEHDRQKVADNMKAGHESPYEVTAQRKDGSTFPAIIRARMMLFRGEPVRVTSVLDITEVKQAQAEVVASKRHLQELSRHLLQAQEETRRRFASELHDRTSPNLAALRINLNFIASATPERRLGHGFVDRVLDTQALIEDTTASIREICADLHPAVLDGAGLLGAVRSYAYQFGQRTGVLVTVACPQAERRLAPELELALFRIVQEAMTNSAKHAMASRLNVQLELHSNPITVVISDDGVGMPADQADAPVQGVGLGMRTMRDTVEFLGGRFSVHTAPGQGTQVRVEIDRAQEELDA